MAKLSGDKSDPILIDDVTPHHDVLDIDHFAP